MIFYIKDRNEKLYATCKYDKDSRKLVLNKASLIKKSFNCSGCDKVNNLRDKLFEQNLLEDHNEEVFLLADSIEIEDINSAACLVLGGKLLDAEKLIKNEFGTTIRQIYAEDFK